MPSHPSCRRITGTIQNKRIGMSKLIEVAPPARPSGAPLRRAPPARPSGASRHLPINGEEQSPMNGEEQSPHEWVITYLTQYTSSRRVSKPMFGRVYSARAEDGVGSQGLIRVASQAG